MVPLLLFAGGTILYAVVTGNGSGAGAAGSGSRCTTPCSPEPVSAVKQVLDPIYEQAFEDSSYGYRPERSPHQCLDELGRTIQQQYVHHIVEADIRSFFDKVNHHWMLKFLEHRIGDPRIIRLISRMLKAGIMEDGLVRASEEGTPQGAILSPLLSNIYLHYALDLWFSRRFKERCRGQAYYFRFADGTPVQA